MPNIDSTGRLTDDTTEAVFISEEEMAERQEEARTADYNLFNDSPTEAQDQEYREEAGYAVSGEVDAVWLDPEQTTSENISYRSPFMTADQYISQRQMNQILYGQPTVFVPEETEEVNLMPKKMTKAKEWSISARALRRVLLAAITGRCRYDYKFQAIYDEHYRIYRIWNGVTQNVVATVKVAGHRGESTVVRYRPNSFYACSIDSIKDFAPGRKVIVIPSKNLHVHRGRSALGTGQTSKTKEAQLGFRRSAYENAMRERDRKNRKK